MTDGSNHHGNKITARESGQGSESCKLPSENSSDRCDARHHLYTTRLSKVHCVITIEKRLARRGSALTPSYLDSTSYVLGPRPTPSGPALPDTPLS
ncbi:hypothetical protein H9L39_02708 [Fusarium oxysporum f. sp. albedinis]|nr:hypothetical protein H9L39_02708 [Fusarium oxysporum f. sp. albedinis]